MNTETSLRKPLPKKILVGYTTNKCHDLEAMDKVTKAIEDGVNVLIWCFVRFQPSQEVCGENMDDDCVSQTDDKRRIRIKASQNFTNFREYKHMLQKNGFGDVIHLVAFGGWNGPHLPSGYSAKELYDAFREFNVDEHMDNEDGGAADQLFDGIDWDLEGHDNIKSTTNEFTKECLDQMGEFSALAKKDGMVVSMAPPESYLDITTQHFSRFVNLTYPEPWHQDFEYHGRNVYAYVLAKWPDAIDFVFIQFYESYSHAAYQISHQGMDPSLFLWEYNLRLETQGGGMTVNFEEDPSLSMERKHISLPFHKLVFGFANGWALNGDVGEKTIFFDSFCVKEAYRKLLLAGRQPRGLGFWVIEEEGKHGVEYAFDLNEILDIERQHSFSID